MAVLAADAELFRLSFIASDTLHCDCDLAPAAMGGVNNILCGGDRSSQEMARRTLARVMQQGHGRGVSGGPMAMFDRFGCEGARVAEEEHDSGPIGMFSKLVHLIGHDKGLLRAAERAVRTDDEINESFAELLSVMSDEYAANNGHDDGGDDGDDDDKFGDGGSSKLRQMKFTTSDGHQAGSGVSYGSSVGLMTNVSSKLKVCDAEGCGKLETKKGLHKACSR